MYFKLPPNPWYQQVVGPAKPPWAFNPPPAYTPAPMPLPKANPLPEPGIVALRNPGEELGQVIPELFSFRAPCPHEGCTEGVGSDTLYRLIQHLNDNHQWTRERIADWLDTLEVDLTFKLSDKESEEENEDVTDS